MSKKKGPTKPRGGGGHSKFVRKSGGNATQSSSYASNSRTGHSTSFSLQDEARNTGHSPNYWDIDTKLRTRRVHFVSAGTYSTMEEDTVPDFSPKLATNSTGDTQRTPSNCSAEPSKSPVSGDEKFDTAPDNALGSPLDSADLFVVDTVGDSSFTPISRPFHIRSASPAKSDSSDEVVFQGRQGRQSQPTVVNDPVHHISAVAKVSAEAQMVATRPAWDDTKVEWVSRSKIGYGWAVPKDRVKPDPELRRPGLRIKKQEYEDAAADDYLENIKEHNAESLQSTTFTRRQLDIELEQGSIYRTLESLTVSDRKHADSDGESISSTGLGSISHETDGDEDVKDDDDDIDSDFEIPDDISEDGFPSALDDAELARLLSKQEELGMGSDELALFDGDLDANVAKAALRYAIETPQKSHRSKSVEVSFSMDVLEEEDVMSDFDPTEAYRPSLQKGKKKARGGEAWDISDDDMNEAAEAQWANDRLNKKERKQKREEERALGIHKYGEGMNIMDIGKEFEAFLDSALQQYAFPPMDKRRRKMIHEIAVAFCLKTKSIGSSKSRHTILIRTKSTTQYSEAKFVAKARKLNMGFFPRLDASGRKGSTREQKAQRANRHGGGSNDVKYRDGDVVGGTAPELGAENRGRAMLERMGWSAGMGLGAGDNTGILQPITHVVKNSRTGLG